MEKIFSAIPYYYGVSDDVPNTVRLTTEMADAVDGEMLQSAVREAIQRYPYFCVKTVLHDNEIMLEENSEEIVVKHASSPIELGAEASNGHLLAFAWDKNTISLDFFHGLADGGGILPLLRTVLYYYCRERYDASLSSEGIRLKGEEISEEEIKDPFPENIDESIKPAGKMKYGQALNLLQAGLVQQGTHMLYKIRIPEEAYMKYSKDVDGSPAAVTALLMARAIAEVHKEASLPIVCGMEMNIRRILGAPMAHHSLVAPILLEYKDAIRNMNIREQALCYRGMIMVQGMDENIMDFIRNNLKLFSRIKDIPDLDGKRAVMQEAFTSFLKAHTFKVSYVGRSALGAAEKYVRSMHVAVSLGGSGMMLEVSAVNSSFCITFQQAWEEDIYVDAFLEQLKREKITYELEGKEIYEVPKIVIGGYKDRLP